MKDDVLEEGGAVTPLQCHVVDDTGAVEPLLWLPHAIRRPIARAIEASGRADAGETIVDGRTYAWYLDEVPAWVFEGLRRREVDGGPNPTSVSPTAK